MSENQVSARSPCISVCALDENDVCTGCFRSAAEITHWVRMSEDERRETNRKAVQRSRKNNPFVLPG